MPNIDLLKILRWLIFLGLLVAIGTAIAIGSGLLSDVGEGLPWIMNLEWSVMAEETTAAEYLGQFADAVGIDGGLFTLLGTISSLAVALVAAVMLFRWLSKVWGD